jgi:hypothetical protein
MAKSYVSTLGGSVKFLKIYFPRSLYIAYIKNSFWEIIAILRGGFNCVKTFFYPLLKQPQIGFIVRVNRKSATRNAVRSLVIY